MIRKTITWVNHCECCDRQYGWHDNKEKARDFAAENPLCASCDGECY